MDFLGKLTELDKNNKVTPGLLGVDKHARIEESAHFVVTESLEIEVLRKSRTRKTMGNKTIARCGFNTGAKSGQRTPEKL